MRRLLIILTIWTTGQCYAGTFDLDTIDNWQIYNGTELILAGHESPPDVTFLGTIKQADLKDLGILFNHCVHYIDDFEVVIEISDNKGKSIMTKTFKISSGTKMIIEKKELGQLTSKLIIIRYLEKRKNGADKILGKINFI